ncbi:MAG: translation initiation factor IF-6 [Halobacteriota archaeon]|nr:translation initiation factor IF-6 [Halobacteriota archaeon]
MIRRFNFDGNPHIGIFATCTDDIALTPPHLKEKTTKSLEEALGVTAIKTFINDSSVVGSLVSGNSNGLIVSSSALGAEIKKIEERADIKVSKLPGVMNASGNLILTNDRAALVHPKLPQKAIEVIESALKVDVYGGTIAGLKTVGMAGFVTNNGILVHPKVKEAELSFLEEIFNLPVEVGTVNFGNPMVGSALIANDKGYAVGSETTGPELGRIEEALGFV